MTRPRISILLPVRDAVATLHAALESIAGQTFADFECLVLDDHSSDASPDVARAWAARDRRFRSIIIERGSGIVAALEAGRALARGDLIARQDADDTSLPDRLAAQHARLTAEPRLAVLGCRARVPGPVTEGMERYLAWLRGCTEPEVLAREIWIESPIVHPTAMARASWLERIGGYRDGDWPEDYDLWLRIHRAGGALSNLAEDAYVWGESPLRLSRTDGRYRPAAFLACRLHHLRRWMRERAIPASRPLIVWGAGRDGRRVAAAWDRETAWGGGGREAPTIAAFVDIDPRKIGSVRRGDRPVLAFEDARRLHPGAFYLGAVGVAGARDLIRSALTETGHEELRDFVCLH